MTTETADDMVRIKYGIEVNFVANASRENTLEVPRAEWDAKTDDEKQAYLNDVAQTEIDNSVNAWAYVEGED